MQNSMPATTSAPEPAKRYEKLLIEDKGRVRIITINRPEKLNALNREVLRDLQAVFADTRKDDRIWAVILTGAGEKAFVAGADIAELAEKTPLAGKEQTL